MWLSLTLAYNKHLPGALFLLLLAVLGNTLPTTLQAQNISAAEKMASTGYAQRFTDTAASLQVQNAALVQAKASGSKEDETICYAYLALTNRRLLNLKGFTAYVDSAYYSAELAKTDRSKAYASLATGLLKSYIEDNSNAVDHLLEAYRLFSKLNSYDHCAKIASDISYQFSPASLPKVQKYAYEALEFATKSGDPESILHARLAVGGYLSDDLSAGNSKRRPEAIAFFEETIALAEKQPDKIISKSNLGAAHINLAVLLMETGKKDTEDKFLTHLEKAKQLARTYNLKNIYRSAIGIQGVYFTQKGDYATAERLFKEGIAYQELLPYKDYILMATFYNSLKQLSVKQKDYAAYYAYDTLFSKYNKFRNDEANQKLLQNADARFESDKKISRIQVLEQENKLQHKNKLLSYGISAVLLAGLVFMFRSYYYRRRYYLKREDVLKQQQTNSELKMQLMEKETIENLADKLSLERRLLRSQMDPHFIFNALGSIQSMVLQHDTAPAVSYLGKFAKLTRQVLEHSRMETISLEEEIQTLKNYIELQQLRLNNSFRYTIDWDASVDISTQVPPLLIQPFVENAIEHGLKPLIHTKEGLLSIQLSENSAGKFLLCTVTDNGIGLIESRRRKENEQHRSLASTITDERLAQMLKDNPHAGFKVSERNAENGQGCVVTLQIPIA